MSDPILSQENQPSGVQSAKIILIDFLIFYLSLVVVTPVFGILLASGFNTGDYVTVACIILCIPPIVGFLLKRRVAWVRPAFLLFTIITDAMAIVSVIGEVLSDTDVQFVRVSIYIALGCIIGVMTCIDFANRTLDGTERRLISGRQWPFVMMLVITVGVFTPAITGGNIATNPWVLIGTQIAFACVWGWVFNLWRAMRTSNSVLKTTPELQKKRSAVFLRGFATFMYRITLLLFFGGILLMNVISRDTFRTILQESPVTYIAPIYPLSIAFYVIIGVDVTFFAYYRKGIKHGSALEPEWYHKGRFLVLLYVIIAGAGAGIGFGIYSFSGIMGWLWVAFMAQVGLFGTVFALLLAVSSRFTFDEKKDMCEVKRIFPIWYRSFSDRII